MSKRSARTRRYFDARLDRLRLAADEPLPHDGWIRAIRDALGMSSSELASRMGVGQSTISGLEHGEVLGTIKLGTLKRVATALECDLVYYLAPRGSLEDVAQAQARRKAREQLADDSPYRDGSVDGGSSRIDELASNYLDQKGLWTD